MWESMGPIADRSSERLGASDIAIIQFRRVMIDAAKKFAQGGAPRRLRNERERSAISEIAADFRGRTRGKEGSRIAGRVAVGRPAANQRR